MDCVLCSSLLAPPQALGAESQLQLRVSGPSACLLAGVGESGQGGAEVGRQTGPGCCPALLCSLALTLHGPARPGCCWIRATLPLPWDA